MADWLRNVVKIQTSNEEFYRLFRQALEDMAALRLPIAGTDHMVFLPAAGLPWFVAPFGRDSLIVSLQNTLIYPEFARGALEILGSLQAKEEDDYRDAEPGKILHEMRYGELAHFKLIPHTPVLRHCRCDAALPDHAARGLARDRRPGALGAASRDRRRMPVLDRQVWRPRRRRISGIPDTLSGRLREHGLEGFGRFASSIPMARWSKDQRHSASYKVMSTMPGCEWPRCSMRSTSRTAPRRCALRPRILFDRFNEAFWDEELGFYAYALDGDKKKVLTVASNAGTASGPASCPRSVLRRSWSG